MLNNMDKGYFYENNEDVKVLMDFIRKPLESTKEIFDIFRNLPNAIYRESGVVDQQKFCYIEGTRPDKVILVAHADTVWYERVSKNSNDILGSYGLERNSLKRNTTHNPIIVDGVVQSTSDVGIGADDRSGIAILWLLKDMGHSLLIVDGEERGMIGSSWIMSHNKDIADKINNEHSFAIQFDRRGSSDFKCYSVGSDEFRGYLQKETLYSEPERFSFTDICTLCTKVTGVNLSVGYYNEHTAREILVIKEWMVTLNMVRHWLSKPDLPRFEIKDIDYWGGVDDFDYFDYSCKSKSSSVTKSKSLLSDNVDEFNYSDYDFDDSSYSNRRRVRTTKSSYYDNKYSRKVTAKYKGQDFDDFEDFLENDLIEEDFEICESGDYYDEEKLEELEEVLEMFKDVPYEDLDQYKELLSEEVYNFLKINMKTERDYYNEL